MKRNVFTYLESPLVHAALVVVVGLLVYSNTFQVPFFLSADYVTENPFVRDISFPMERLKQLNSDHYGLVKSRYLPYLTFALNYRLHGFNVFGYHAVNLLFHLLDALLVYALVIQIFRTPLLQRSSLRERQRPLALFVALLFVAHPVQTEAVTWIWHGRSAVLTAFFFLGALVAYLRGRLEDGWGRGYLWYGVAVLSAALAMKCKQNAVTLPFMAALFEFAFFSGGIKSRIIRLIPLGLTLLIIPATYLFDMGFSLEEATTAFKPVTGQEMTRLDYLFTQFRVLINYLRLFFVPVGLPAFREWTISRSLLEPAVLASGASLASLLGLGVYLVVRCRRTKPEWALIGVGIVWYFIGHSVESGIIPLSVLTAVYRNYLPSVGVFLAVGTAVFLLSLRFDRGKVPAISLSAGALLLVLAISAYARNGVWRTEISLAEDVVKNSPESPQAHFIMSKAYKSQGMMTEAGREVDLAFRLDMAAHPELVTGGANLTGMSTTSVPKKLLPEEVEEYFRQAVENHRNGRPENALEGLQAVLAADPDHAGAHYHRALIFHEQGMTDAAAGEYRAVLRLKPDFVAARSDYAGLLAQMGQFPEAIAELKTALRYKPDYPEAHRFLGMIYQDTGRLADAVSAFKSAIRYNPAYADAHNSLGEAYVQMGDPGNAATEFRTALRLKPDHEGARQNLVRITGR